MIYHVSISRSQLVRIRDGAKKLAADISAMEVRIGVLQHQLWARQAGAMLARNTGAAALPLEPEPSF